MYTTQADTQADTLHYTGATQAGSYTTHRQVLATT